MTNDGGEKEKKRRQRNGTNATKQSKQNVEGKITNDGGEKEKEENDTEKMQQINPPAPPKKKNNQHQWTQRDNFNATDVQFQRNKSQPEIRW